MIRIEEPTKLSDSVEYKRFRANLRYAIRKNTDVKNRSEEKKQEEKKEKKGE